MIRSNPTSMTHNIKIPTTDGLLHTYIYIYIYIYKERERERERERDVTIHVHELYMRVTVCE